MKKAYLNTVPNNFKSKRLEKQIQEARLRKDRRQPRHKKPGSKKALRKKK